MAAVLMLLLRAALPHIETFFARTVRPSAYFKITFVSTPLTHTVCVVLYIVSHPHTLVSARVVHPCGARATLPYAPSPARWLTASLSSEIRAPRLSQLPARNPRPARPATHRAPRSACPSGQSLSRRPAKAAAHPSTTRRPCPLQPAGGLSPSSSLAATARRLSPASQSGASGAGGSCRGRACRRAARAAPAAAARPSGAAPGEVERRW